MSTSPSDGNKPGAPSGAPGGVGVSSLFKRAVVAHKEKQATQDETNAPVDAGVELTCCNHCGAPRQREELVCHFCGGKL